MIIFLFLTGFLLFAIVCGFGYLRRYVWYLSYINSLAYESYRPPSTARGLRRLRKWSKCREKKTISYYFIWNWRYVDFFCKIKRMEINNDFIIIPPPLLRLHAVYTNCASFDFKCSLSNRVRNREHWTAKLAVFTSRVDDVTSKRHKHEQRTATRAGTRQSILSHSSAMSSDSDNI